MRYYPLNYSQINAIEGTYNPSQVKAYNNKTFAFWERSLFQRACSIIDINLPEEWSGEVKDFFLYSLYRFGYLTVFNDKSYGTIFQPCTLNGRTVYYQPTECLVSNPAFKRSLRLNIGKDCELIKLTPDYQGVWDVITYFAEKLSNLDGAINMSITNAKVPYFIAAKNKAAAEAWKKALDKVNNGEPSIILDKLLTNDREDGDEPWQFLDIDIQSKYLLAQELQDMQTILNAFDAEIGIPTVPYQKKERMVTSEAESRQIDSMSRSIIWYETLTSSLDKVNRMFPELNIEVSLRYKDTQSEADAVEKGVDDNG